MGGPGSGAKLGNQNARGSLSTRNLDAREKAARLKADRHLNRITPLAVATLEKILRNKKSTHMDLIAASREVLDRKIPKISHADVVLGGAPAVLLRIPGLNWPAIDSTPAPIAERLTLNAIHARNVLPKPNGNGANGA